MREILFRGKRKDNGEWVEGNLIQSPYMGEVRSWISTPEDKTRLRAIATYYGDWRAVEVGTDTICQYTGLTDKNGNKIWENDVIKDSDNDVGIVNYGMDGRASFVVYYEKKTEYILLGKNNIEMLKIEVIGNIFDNADLLKGE